MESLIVIRGCQLSLYTHYDCQIDYSEGHYREVVQSYPHRNLVVRDIEKEAALKPFSKYALTLTS